MTERVDMESVAGLSYGLDKTRKNFSHDGCVPRMRFEPGPPKRGVAVLPTR